MSPMAYTRAVRRARKAASKRGLEASLSITAWSRTCADMEYRCVYCGNDVSVGGSLDHFVPMAWGGGTTITNCVLSCLWCNLCKGNSLPEIFLAHDPERLARLRYYLAHRRSWQRSQSFWSFILPKEEQSVNRDAMQSTPYSLASGKEVSVYNDEQHTVLQLRQLAPSDIDPFAPSFQVATVLTPSECVALAATLLLYASPKIEDKHPSEAEEKSSSPWL